VKEEQEAEQAARNQQIELLRPQFVELGLSIDKALHSKLSWFTGLNPMRATYESFFNAGVKAAKKLSADEIKMVRKFLSINRDLRALSDDTAISLYRKIKSPSNFIFEYDPYSKGGWSDTFRGLLKGLNLPME
jgi:hypothetical protein